MLLPPGNPQRRSPHRERLFCRPTSNRLRRCDADPRLQRLARLCPEQARPDHVHIRPRTRTRSRNSHSKLPASCYLHGNDHGAAERRQTAQHLEEGAEAILNLAVSQDTNGRTGEFFNGLLPSRSDPQAYDESARKRLRALSLNLTGLK
jgi:hypothetical protein